MDGCPLVSMGDGSRTPEDTRTTEHSVLDIKCHGVCNKPGYSAVPASSLATHNTLRSDVLGTKQRATLPLREQYVSAYVQYSHSCVRGDAEN